MEQAGRTMTRARRTGARRTGPRRRLVPGLAVAALLASLATACGSGSDDSLQPPRPFPGHDVSAALSGAAAPGAEDHRAQRAMSAWWRTHDAQPHDTAFARYLEQSAPPPPPTTDRRREIDGLRSLAAARTSAGVTAASWLDDHGKDDIWKQYADRLPTGGQSAGDEMDDMLDLGSQVADALKTRFHQPSPYVVDPGLRKDKAGQAADAGTCTCSYPSTHSTDSAAAVTYLSRLDPSRAGSYRHMQQEVLYSRLYMAGHTPSDLATGTLLGDMLGEYFLVTRHHVPAPAAP